MLAVSLGLALPATAGYAISRTPDHTPVWPNVIATTTRTVTVEGRYKGATAHQWARRTLQAVSTAHQLAGRARDLRRVLLARPNVTEAINLAAVTYGVSRSFMRSLAWCESRFDPNARNPSSSTGLFQVLYPSTWSTTPYAGFSPYSAYANSLAAAYMLAHGRRSEWVC